MRLGQGVRTGLGGVTCVLQTQFSSFHMSLVIKTYRSDFYTIISGSLENL